jgi:lipopolysaccharide export system permease protein
MGRSNKVGGTKWARQMGRALRAARLQLSSGLIFALKRQIIRIRGRGPARFPRENSPMTLFDRYVLGLFLKIMVVCFCSLAGLYLVIDVFNNLDDFSQIAKREGSLGQVLLYYYAPRLLALFGEVVGLLALLAAICTLTRLQTTNELAAVQAAGITIRRVALPMLVVSALLLLVTLAAREWSLPKFRAIMLANAQEILKTEPTPVVSQIDYDSLIMFRGASIDPQAGAIEWADLLLPHDWLSTDPHVTSSDPSASDQPIVPRSVSTPVVNSLAPDGQLRARRAVWQPANENHPAGFLLQGVRADIPLRQVASIHHNGRQRILTPSEHAWLQPDQCFVPTPLSVWQLAYGTAWFRSASLSELVQINQTGSIRMPSVQRIELHWRLARPIMDFLILLIGLPLVLRPGGQKLVIAAGYCGMLVFAVQLLVMFTHFLGGQQLVRPAALAAWLPVLTLVPWAAWAYSRFDY